MSLALVSTGLWMRVDVASTPTAVVICVIVFNAAFGYRCVKQTQNHQRRLIEGLAGAQFHGSIPLRSARSQRRCLGSDLSTLRLLDHALAYPRKGRVHVDGNELGFQLADWPDDAVPPR